VRSNGFGFAIAVAPKTDLNPLGLSFAVMSEDKPRLYLWAYGVAAVAVMAAAVGVSILMLRRRAKKKAASQSVSVTEPSSTDGQLPPQPPAGPEIRDV
jgi:hypothetical protein